MKKSFYLLLMSQLFFSACFSNLSDKSDSFDVFIDEWDMLKPHQVVCSSIKDAFIFPVNWTGEDLDNFSALPIEYFHSMSTCGLLETLFEHPTNRMTGAWCVHCSNSDLPGITMFNNRLDSNNVAVELFKRSDCFSVLASKYLSIIKEKRKSDFQIQFFEMLLASDMCMKTLDETEKVLLMAMTLERKVDEGMLSSTRYIMIAIMKSCNYNHFLNDVGEKLVEYTWGYRNINEFEILKYSKQFLKEKNIKV